MKDVPETNSVDERLVAPLSVEPARPVAPAVKPRVVIVGAGFGGLQAARALRDAPVQVTVIDRNNHHLFQPLLYQVATAVLSPADICAPIRNVLRKQENAEVLLAEVTGVDVQAQRVLMYDESIPRILTAFPESLSNKAYKALNRLRVEVRTNSPVESIDSEGVVVAGERIPAKTIIWTAGVRASPAGEWLGAETDRAGRVKVGSDMTLPGHANIFVIGDTASASQDGKPLPGVAQVAIQQGHYVASVIADRAAGKEDTHAFHYVDKGNLAVIGRFYGIGVIGKWRFTGLLGWFVWLVVHLMFLIGYRNRLVVTFQWLVYFTTFQRGARLIKGDEAATLEGPLHRIR